MPTDAPHAHRRRESYVGESAPRPARTQTCRPSSERRIEKRIAPSGITCCRSPAARAGEHTPGARRTRERAPRPTGAAACYAVGDTRPPHGEDATQGREPRDWPRPPLEHRPRCTLCPHGSLDGRAATYAPDTARTTTGEERAPANTGRCESDVPESAQRTASSRTPEPARPITNRSDASCPMRHNVMPLTCGTRR